MRSKVMGMALCCVGSVAWAQSPQATVQDLRACAAYGDDGQRLACFDKVAARSAAQGSATVGTLEPSGPISSGKWMVLEDTRSTGLVTAMLSSESGTGMGDVPVDLVAKCEQGRLVVYAAWNMRLGDTAEVTAIIGNDAPIVREWPLSPDREVSILPADATGFLMRLSTADSLVLSVWPKGYPQKITALFDLHGYDLVLPELRKSCRF